MKVVCEKCESSFKFEAVKDMECCPVCGEAFDMGDAEIENDLREESLMYFDVIDIFKDEPEYSNVNAYCSECGENNSLEIDKFDKLINKEYVLLKEGVTVTCRGCGKEHTARKIPYKKKDHYAPSLPHCPACNSVMLKKIKTSSKFLAAATIGTFALPYNSKTFECKNCGYRF